MNANGYVRISCELFNWITFLTQALPTRSIGTFIEWLLVAMLTPTGFVTYAYLMLAMKIQWFSYNKWLESGRWSWLALARQFTRLALTLCVSVVFMSLVRARIDTCLYDAAAKAKPGQRGRPRKYGEKYTAKRIAHLKKTTVSVILCGREQRIRYRTKLVKARFLNGFLVRAVWYELESKDGSWKPARLFLSTDTSLTGKEVIESYGLRWSIESMFNQLKLAWGLKEAWQQTRQTLYPRVHITMVGYGLTQLLNYISTSEVQALCRHSPWRKDSPVTAG